MALNYVNLSVDLYDGSGAVLTSGTASFVPSVQLTDAADNEIITAAPVIAAFKAGGAPVVRLLATDNAAPLPAGWAWTVTFTGVAGNPASFSFFLPFSGGGSQSLADLSPVSSAVTQYPANPLTTLGDIVYENATPTPARLGGNTTAQIQYLSQTGNGSVSAAPAWGVVSGQFLCTPNAYAPSGQTVLTTTSATMAAVSSANINTGAFAAPASGAVIVGASFIMQTSVASSAMAFGLCAHGTVTPMVGFEHVFKAPAATQPSPYLLQFLVTGLTPGTGYNFDLMFAIAAASTLTVYANNQSATGPTLNAGAVGGPVVMTVQAV